MILADDIIAAVGGAFDAGGILTSIAKSLRHAERFVLADDVADAGYDLISSRPSSLLDALPRCRVPYPLTWLEWSGAASARSGWALEPYTEKIRSDPALFKRTTPIKLGCLIESDPADKGERGSMTWAWMLPNRTLSASGMGVMFDYTGNVLDWGRAALKQSWAAPLLDRLAQEVSDEALSSVMLHSLRWGKLVNDPVQREALRQMQRFECYWFSRHGWGLVEEIVRTRPPLILQEMTRAWIGDICGEATFIDAILMMMSSRNAVEHDAVDLSRLNRARGKNGKPPLLSHRVTRLHLSRTRQRAAAAAGMSRAEARAHMVRGHFKIRRTGVYWWSPFVRGHGGGLERSHYEVR